jgi:hypothetical protein
MSNVFGKAKFGNKRNWFKLKDGESVYRILPPMGACAEDGIWSKFYSIHYGYKNSKGETRAFQSPLIKNNKTKMVEVPDAALERISQLLAKLEDAKKAKNDELVTQLLKLVGGQKSRYNLDSNHYLNVVDLQGNVGVLKIRHKAKLALQAAIDKLRANGVEPLDPESGRYFVFSRSGSGRDTLYQVFVYEKEISVEGVGKVKQEVVHTITDELAARCVVRNKDGSYTYREAANLLTLFKKPTSEQVARIVKEGEKAVDEILDSKAATDSSADSSEGDSGLEDDESAESPVAATAAPLAAAPIVSAPAPVAAAKPAAKAAPVAATPVATAPKTTAEVVTEQDDAEFLKSLGL